MYFYEKQCGSQKYKMITTKESTHHLSLSLLPAENRELLKTSPISSRQKLKLLIVHMYENFTTLTWNVASRLKGHNDVLYSSQFRMLT